MQDPAQDEIDQILNEVEELRKELDASDATTAKPVALIQAPAVPSGVEPRLEDLLKTGSDSQPEESADDLMKEFHSHLKSSDSSMEETLASVKVDSSVKTILDESDSDSQTDMGEIPDERPEFDDGSENSEYRENNVIALHDKVVHEKMAQQSSGNSFKPVESAEPGCLKMTLSGNMTLKLQYEYAGQEVSISFIDDCLKVETHGGAEFKIPFGSGPASNKKKPKQAV
jgi:hypothetical protein